MDADTTKTVRLLEFLASKLRSGEVKLLLLDSAEDYTDNKSDDLRGQLRFEWLRIDAKRSKG